MNISQANLYEVLDAFAIDATVGNGVFTIHKDIHIDNGVIDVNLRVEGLHIRETNTGLYALMKIGDLGIVAISRAAEFSKVCLIDFSHPIAASYFALRDFDALLNHLSEEAWRPDFVIENIEC